MSTPVRPTRDRAGRVYTPAVGPRLRPCSGSSSSASPCSAANGVYLASVTALTWYLGTTQQTFFYMLMVALHLVLGLLARRPVPGLRLRAPGDLVEAAEQGGGPLRPGRSWPRGSSSWSRAWSWSGSAASRSATRGSATSATGSTSSRRSRRSASTSSTGWPARGSAGTGRGGSAWPVVGFVVVMGLLHFAGPPVVRRQGAEGGQAVLLPVRGRHGQRQVHPGRDADDGRLLPEVPQGRLRGLVPLVAPLQLVQQQGVPVRASARPARSSLERDGNTQAARWCAGCHDPVPFFSGEFDDPNYDDVNNPTSQAGITCTVCHAITNVNSTRGNADYTIEEPQHYPFASSDNPVLQWINNTLVKAKPEMHKKTFLKPVIKDSKFCSTCHKVGLPFALNHYKDFLRGQNHYDTFLLSGVSGHGARSFYYPPVAKGKLRRVPHGTSSPSTDFGAKDFDGKGGREIHDHLFLGANTGLADDPGRRRGRRDARASSSRTRRSASTSSASARGARSTASSLGPLRPEVPTLKPGEQVPGRGRRPDARPRPPVQPGDGRLQRDLGRADRQAGRPGHRPVGRDRRRTARSTRTRTSSTSTCSTATATGSTAATRRTSSSRSTTSRSPRAPARSSTSASTSPRASTGRSRSKRRSTTASSTASTWTTSSARGRGPSCRSS